MLRYQDLAFRTAFLTVLDAAEAEDVSQEAFLKAYDALARFRPERPFRPWLLKIVINEARNRRRAAARHRQLADRLTATFSEISTTPCPEVAAEEAERREILLEAVNELPQRDQLVIACRYFLDLSEEETATVLSCRTGTVKSRLSRALARLRLALTSSETNAWHEGVEVARE